MKTGKSNSGRVSVGSSDLVRHAVDQWIVVIRHNAPISHMWAVLSTHYQESEAEKHAANLRACDDVSANWATATVVRAKVSFRLPNVQEHTTPRNEA
jgi:hypothetical protein